MEYPTLESGEMLKDTGEMLKDLFLFVEIDPQLCNHNNWLSNSVSS